jgi:hypothetical protein
VSEMLLRQKLGWPGGLLVQRCRLATVLLPAVARLDTSPVCDVDAWFVCLLSF